MATITQIEIDGFKAFPKNFKLDLGTGKNLLLYGENGSGKSSLYYALHALLQSVFKDDKGAKYFKTGDTNGEEFIINNEQLINIFRFNEAKDNTYTPYVRITFDDGKIWRLDNGGLSSENGGNESEIRILNKNSAFINHSYISRFHAARNSEEIDLWNVFYKDILPFYVPVGTEQFLADLYDEIVSECNSSPKPRTSRRSLKNKIVDFNSYLEQLVGDINKKASSIYNDYFRRVGDHELTIKIAYYKKEAPENINKDNYQLYYGRDITGVLELNQPKIGIEIKENGLFILKPQSHFNEAKLTAIALAVRFAAMSRTIVSGSFVALDDMLISLDMGNRMKVIDYIFKEVLPKYKLYIFTHDRLLFTSFKKRINADKLQGDWLCGGVYMHDRDNPIDFNLCNPYPIFVEEQDALLSAREYYIMHDYPACGQRLRKWCEDILERLYPDVLLKSLDSTTGKSVNTSLNDRIIRLNDYCINESIDFDEFKDLKIYKDNVLNTVSHHDVSSPIYGNEILSIMRILSKLDQIATNKRLVVVNRQLGIELIANDGRPITVCIDIRSKKLNIVEYNGMSRVSYYTKCLVYKIIDAGVHAEITPEVSFDSIYNAYKSYCEKYGADSNIDLLDVLYDHGTLIKDKL